MDKTLQTSTIDLYKKMVAKLIKLKIMVNNKIININDFINGIEKNKISNSQKKIMISALLWYYKTKNINLPDNLKNDFKKIMDDIRQKQIEIAQQNLLTNREKKNFVRWEIIKKVFKKLELIYKKDKTLNNVTNLLMVGLYVLNKPRRIADYLYMSIVKNEPKNLEKKNYCILGEKKFLFNNYKTAKIYGKTLININTKLFNIILDYIKLKKLHYGDNLFEFKAKSIFITKLESIFQKYIGKTISVSLLRHIYITHLIDNNMIKSTKDKLDIAKLMGNSIPVQADYYRIITRKMKKDNIKLSNTTKFNINNDKNFLTYKQNWYRKNKEKVKEYNKKKYKERNKKT